MECWICGKKTSTMYRRGTSIGTSYLEKMHPNDKSYLRCYCSDCIDSVIDVEKREVELYSILKHKIMFYKACNALEAQGVDLYKYKEAIGVVENKVVSSPDKFDSSYEVMAAIILVQNRIYSKMQYQIGRYRVDFFLEEEGVILEIDGERHKYKKQKDRVRDAQIKNIIGQGWEIIRIDTNFLDQHAERLPIAIREVMNYRETNHIDWRKLSSK